jgi:hypothetical protein
MVLKHYLLRGKIVEIIWQNNRPEICRWNIELFFCLIVFLMSVEFVLVKR